jgi:hypothetical protein
VQVLHALTPSVAALVVATTVVPNSKEHVQSVPKLCWIKIVVLPLVLLIYVVLVPASTILVLMVHPILVSQTVCALILSNAHRLTVVSAGVTKREIFESQINLVNKFFQ